MKKIVFYDEEKSFIRGLERYVSENGATKLEYKFFESFENYKKYILLNGKNIDLVVCPEIEKEHCSSFGNYKILTLNFESITSEISRLYSCDQVVNRIEKEIQISNVEIEKIFLYDPYFILDKNKVLHEVIKSNKEKVLILDFTIDGKNESGITQISDLLYQIDWNWNEDDNHEMENNKVLKQIINEKINCESGRVFYYKICETKYDISTVNKEKASSIAREILNVDVDKIVVVSNCDVSRIFIEFLREVEMIKIFQTKESLQKLKYRLSKEGYYEMINSDITIEFSGDLYEN